MNHVLHVIVHVITLGYVVHIVSSQQGVCYIQMFSRDLSDFDIIFLVP